MDYQGQYCYGGEEEYEEAGVWTNESVLARATEILSLSSIRWA